MRKTIVLSILAVLVTFFACKKQDNNTASPASLTAIKARFGTRIDPTNLLNYSGQLIPAYIRKDNSAGSVITNEKATLGRVLFYDKNLSFNNSVSCGSCHKQEFAFSDTAVASAGVQGGVSSRHSMRLINSRFAQEVRFFWDERAATLEEQTTKPIQDHAEMGFSGLSGRPTINDLIARLNGIDYYKELFQLYMATRPLQNKGCRNAWPYL